ncbi:hypothetical protein ACLB2K_014678 [Fragaria x ananassa]
MLRDGREEIMALIWMQRSLETQGKLGFGRSPKRERRLSQAVTRQPRVSRGSVLFPSAIDRIRKPIWKWGCRLRSDQSLNRVQRLFIGCSLSTCAGRVRRGEEETCEERRGEARRGKARRGEPAEKLPRSRREDQREWRDGRDEASPLQSFCVRGGRISESGEARLGEARRGEERRGEARRGEERRGEPAAKLPRSRREDTLLLRMYIYTSITNILLILTTYLHMVTN